MDNVSLVIRSLLVKLTVAKRVESYTLFAELAIAETANDFAVIPAVNPVGCIKL